MADEQKVTGLYLSSATNSTKFTVCCGLAVVESETKCPGCGARVERDGAEYADRVRP